MNKSNVMRLFLAISIIIAVVFGCLAYIEKASAATGLATLAGFGRFVFFGLCFCVSTVISILILLVLISHTHKSQKRPTDNADQVKQTPM